LGNAAGSAIVTVLFPPAGIFALGYFTYKAIDLNRKDTPEAEFDYGKEDLFKYYNKIRKKETNYHYELSSLEKKVKKGGIVLK